jgi:hypothetical protein
MRRVPQAAGKLMGILALIVSPLGKLIGILSLIAGVALGGYLLLKQHDADVLANQNLVTQKAIMAQQAKQAAATIAALQQENAQAEIDVVASASVKRTISNAPSSSSCAHSPAIGAALLGLQQPGSGHAAAGKASR